MDSGDRRSTRTPDCSRYLPSSRIDQKLPSHPAFFCKIAIFINKMS